MIGALRGRVLEVLDGPELLVEVGGVGYRVSVPARALESVTIGQEVFLHVHTHVREDAIVLYGFQTKEARACFEALIAAHGVGPSLALAVLCVHTPAALYRAVHGGDRDALTLVPGIGAKTAARLLIELQSSLGEPVEVQALDGPAAAADGHGAASGPLAEVRAALAGLGYTPEEVRSTLRSLPSEGRAEDLVRIALRELAGRR